jgi:hypothetical protein
VTFFEIVWAEAAIVFGKKNGEPESLTPFSRTWKQIVGRAEHALWLWNDKYGPLNAEQRVYAAQLVTHALRQALLTQVRSERYAYFNATLTRLLNHETVHAGFQSRKDSTPEIDVVGDLYEAVAA